MGDIMNEIFSIPQPLDFTNPYGLDLLELVDLNQVEYTPGLEIGPGQITYDTDEDAFWISPTTVTRGYIRMRGNDNKIAPGDIIKVSYEFKCLNEVPRTQGTGIVINTLSSTNALLSDNLRFFPSLLESDSYELYEFESVIPASENGTVDRFNIIIGSITTFPIPQYSYKIKNIKIEIVHRTGDLVKLPYKLTRAGYNVNSLSAVSLVDNATTRPNTGARDPGLKSGFYGLLSNTSGGDNSLGANGNLIVLPYRGPNDTNGNTAINHIAITTNGTIFSRNYDNATNTFTDWNRLNNKVTSTTGRRTNAAQGDVYFDYTISKLIWWNGVRWSDQMGNFVNVPLNKTSNGTKGDFSANANYVYICRDTNQWVRIAVDTTW